MDTAEHPFAPFIRILGKGPRTARHLSRDEAREAGRLIFADAVEPVQLGAFLCLLRLRGETPEELAGLAEAARASLLKPANPPQVALDWPSYAGKRDRLPWFLLAALLLARDGHAVLLHGEDSHTPGRISTAPALRSLGVPPAGSLEEAAERLRAGNIAFLPLAALSPHLHAILGLKPLLGLRNPFHSVARALNPLSASAQIVGVAHPAYRTLHRDAGALLGQPRMAVLKGDGGEAERRPAKPCPVAMLADGVASEETWAPLSSGATPEGEAEPREIGALAALWRGSIASPGAEAAVAGTAAIALKLLGRAATMEEAEDVALRLWRQRDRRLDA